MISDTLFRLVVDSSPRSQPGKEMPVENRLSYSLLTKPPMTLPTKLPVPVTGSDKAPTTRLPPDLEAALGAPALPGDDDDAIGFTDVTANPFGGVGDNPDPVGTTPMPGYPGGQKKGWDAQSARSVKSAAGTIGRAGTGKTLTKKISKIFSTGRKGMSEPTSPEEPISRSPSPLSKTVFHRLTGSQADPKGKSAETLTRMSFASRGPPAGTRTSALASPSATGEGKNTKEGKIPVGGPEITADMVIEDRVARLEDLTTRLAASFEALLVERDLAVEKAKEDREALNRTIGNLRAIIQDAVGKGFRVPTEDPVVAAPRQVVQGVIPSAALNPLAKRKKKL